MARKLASYVLVRDSKFKSHMFGPDDDVPGWAAELITMRSAWADSGDEAQAPVTDEPSESDAPKRRGRPRST